MEIGIDIEQIERFKNVSSTFINRVYAPSEIEYAQKLKNSPAELCAMWCVKEATVKAFSNLKMTFSQIVVCRDKNGKPFIEKNDMILAELKKLNLTEIKVSISHSKDYATATVLIY